MRRNNLAVDMISDKTTSEILDNLTYAPHEICDYFQIPRTTLFRWEKDGKIPTVLRDKEGNRIYSRRQFELIAKKVATRLSNLQKRIHKQIESLDTIQDADAIKDAKKNLRDLISDYCFVQYLSDGNPTNLVELKHMAIAGDLPKYIRRRILIYLINLPMDSEDYIRLIEILYNATQVSYLNNHKKDIKDIKGDYIVKATNQ